jgi:hypothetical protein
MMTYPSVDDFKDILLSKPLETVVQEYIFQRTPYVFRNRPEALKGLKQHLCSALEILDQNIVVVGSAQTGFSLNPNNFPRQFSEESDIDILTVDEKLFDEVWMILLKWNYPRRLVKKPGKVEGDWVYSRRKDIYWGWFSPDEIHYEGLSFPEALKPLRDISTKWFNAFRSLSQYTQYPEFAHRDVSGRLYRTWNHALLYHVEGLRQVKHTISPA